jgi:hypothetical protein
MQRFGAALGRHTVGLGLQLGRPRSRNRNGLNQKLFWIKIQ